MAPINPNSHVFAIWGSPAGGKSTLAVNMAVILADSGYMTCLVSAADHGELQTFLGTAIPQNKGLNAALSNGRHVRESLTEARPNLFILEPSTGGDAYDIANLRTEQIDRIISDLRDHFAYIIIDCMYYKESVFTGLGLAAADKVVVCMPYRANAAIWYTANMKMQENIANKTMLVLCDTREGGCQEGQLLGSIGVSNVAVKLPLVPSAYMCENIARPIVLNNGKCERRYKEAVLKLVRALLEVEQRERANNGQGMAQPKKRGLFGRKQPAEQTARRPAPEMARRQPETNAARRMPTENLRMTEMSRREQRKAEEAAMRRAQQQFFDDDDDEYDDD